MFFMRLIRQSLTRQLGRRALIAVVIFLSTAVSVAMLGVLYDVGDKLNAELASYGSNITVKPKAAAVVSDLYGTSGGTDPTAFIAESDAVKMKTIFWSYNITDFAPKLHQHVTVSDEAGGGSAEDVQAVGTWFARRAESTTGETVTTGVKGMRSWWTIEGEWASDDADQAMLGSTLAKNLGASVGDTVTIGKDGAERTLTVTGIYTSGDDEDSDLYLPSTVLEDMTGHPDEVDEIEVKALTTPENDLSRKAEINPATLSQADWETWYCTAYASSIAYQIEEVIPGSVAKQVRQVEDLENTVLSKTQAVMIVMTVLTLVSAVIAVANLMASSITERAAEFALLKAIGARNGALARLVLAETAVIALVGAALGALAGAGLAQVIGHAVFDSGITMRPMVFVLVAVILAVTLLLASLASLGAITRVHPAQVLHGR